MFQVGSQEKSKQAFFKNYMLIFPLWWALLGGSFVFLDVGPSILFLVFPLFWVLWFLIHWQGFILYMHNTVFSFLAESSCGL
jgi:hypothetical protein